MKIRYTGSDDWKNLPQVDRGLASLRTFPVTENRTPDGSVAANPVNAWFSPTKRIKHTVTPDFLQISYHLLWVLGQLLGNFGDELILRKYTTGPRSGGFVVQQICPQRPQNCVSISLHLRQRLLDFGDGDLQSTIMMN